MRDMRRGRDGRAPDRCGRRHLRFVLVFALCFIATRAFPYNIWIDGKALPPADVTLASVLGEARKTPATSDPGSPDRFHSGVDRGCSEDDPVNSIEEGWVTKILEDKNVGFVEVLGKNTGRSFRYVHIAPRVPEGATVYAGTAIGTILPITPPHLHLTEIWYDEVSATRYAVNPSREGALEFADDISPELPAGQTTVGGKTPPTAIIPVPEITADPDGSADMSALRPFPPAPGTTSVFEVTGAIDLLVTARDGPSRKGIYSLETYIVPPEGGEAVYSNTYQFDTVLFPLRDPDTGTHRDARQVYLWRNAASDVYISTNHKQNFDADVQGEDLANLDVSAEAFHAGYYRVMVTAGDLCGEFQHKVSSSIWIHVKKVQLEEVSIGPDPSGPPFGSRIYPIRFNFACPVKGVRVLEPSGSQLVTLAYPETWSGTTFDGTIDLSNVCLDGQSLCVRLAAAVTVGEVDYPGEAASEVVVPEPEGADEPAMTGVYAGTFSNGKAYILVEFSAPVVNLSLNVSPRITLEDGTHVLLSVGQATPVPSGQGGRRWVAVITSCVAGTQALQAPRAGKLKISAAWEKACDDIAAGFGCVSAGTYRQQGERMSDVSDPIVAFIDSARWGGVGGLTVSLVGT